MCWCSPCCSRCVTLLSTLCKMVDRLVRIVSRLCLVLFFVYALLSVEHTPTLHTSSTTLPHTSWLGRIKPNPNVSAVVIQPTSSVTLSFPAQSCPVTHNTTQDVPLGTPIAAFHAACASSFNRVRKFPSSSFFCILQCIGMPLGGLSVTNTCCIPLGTLGHAARAALGSALNHTRWLSPGHWFPTGFAVVHLVHVLVKYLFTHL
jgi:hypothetical protein